MITIQDIMSKEVVSLTTDMLLGDAAKILAEHSFDGAPVIDGDGKLVGILTEYDLISKGSVIHLPTFQFILQNLQIFKKDRSHFEKEIKDLSDLKVKDVMNSDPLTLSDAASYEDAVRAFQEHHRVNPIPVIDENRKVVGVVSRFDVLKPLRNM